MQEKGNISVLIVDDSLFMRNVLKEIVSKAGYTIAGEAATGRAAIQKSCELRPDVVLLDITMPEIDGLQALVEIVKLEPQINIIMCSAMGQQGIVMEALQKGAKDFIIKPFQQEKVVDSIERALANASVAV